jgi:uncharacterized protein YndB with AHSA1/START domain
MSMRNRSIEAPVRHSRSLALAVLAASVLLAAAGPLQAQTAAPSDVKTAVQAEADGSTTLNQSIVVNAALPEVWQALTTSDGWRGWAAPFAVVDFRIGGVIETSYQANAQAGAPENIRNQIVAYLPQRLFAIRNVQAPRNAPFDVPTFQSLHTVVLLDAVGERSTRVAFVQPGYRSGEPYDTVLKHFRWGNGWTLEQLKKRFDVGPVDWAKLAAEAQKASAKK